MSFSPQHVLEEIALGEKPTSEASLPALNLGAVDSNHDGISIGGAPKGGASHVKGKSVEGLARKYALHVMGQPPEAPQVALAGATAPQFELQKETTAHRFVIYLKSLGRTTAEIAELSGFCEVHVRQILAQPWARQQLARLLEQSDPAQLIPTLIAQAAAASVATMIEIRDDEKQPASVRAKVCDSLLDRFLGKAVQQIHIKPMRPESDDDASLDQRLKELQDAERDLIGRPKVREMPEVNLEVIPSSVA